MRRRRRRVVAGLVAVLCAGAVVAFANSMTVTSRHLDAKVTPTSLTTTTTALTPPVTPATPSFSVTAPATATAGTAFNVTLQARLGTANDPTVTGAQCVTFSGPGTSPGPVATAPSYPVQGACAAGQSSVAFVSGAATVPVTLFKAETVAVAVTSALRSGTSGAVAVNSQGVALAFSTACPTVHTKNTTRTYTLNVPKDSYGNSFTSNAGLVVSLTLTGADAPNYKFSSTQSQSLSITVTSGPAANSFTVNAEGAKKDATLGGSVTASGFTAPSSCALTGTS